MLFLDELAEFDRPALDALRQPLEEGVVGIARATGHVRYPARFQLVAAMNPCRCGHFNDASQRCRCAPGDPERYVRRVSGPLLDRIDIQVEMERVPTTQLLRGPKPESSAVVRERIAAARRVALERNAGRPNAQLPATAVVEACRLEKAADNVLVELGSMHHLSARQTHRMMRVARSIADLREHEHVSADDVLAAVQLRDPGTVFDRRAAA